MGRGLEASPLSVLVAACDMAPCSCVGGAESRDPVRDNNLAFTL